MYDEDNVRLTLGDNLLEECVACLLGGHGISAAVGVAAFNHLKHRQLIHTSISPAELEAALLTPLQVNNRLVRYRFSKQKSIYISALFRQFESAAIPETPLALRSWLLQVPGIGPKTASWIVRNVHDSDDVAILDIHIIRAGQLMNLFPAKIRLPSQYDVLEKRYLDFCKALGVRASRLDACIWAQMKKYRASALMAAHPNGKRAARQLRTTEQNRQNVLKQAALL
jgi:thermostable 8-oxoguanine DNA glycosylase